jgi:hypothetical protein
MELEKYEQETPMTPYEKRALRRWVISGHGHGFLFLFWHNQHLLSIKIPDPAVWIEDSNYMEIKVGCHFSDFA